MWKGMAGRIISSLSRLMASHLDDLLARNGNETARNQKANSSSSSTMPDTRTHTHTRTQIDASESHHSERRLSITLFELIRLAQNRRDRWMERWNRAEQVSVVLFLSCKSKSIAFLLTLIVRVCCTQYIYIYR